MPADRRQDVGAPGSVGSFHIINLSALQLAAVVDVNRLPFRENVEDLRTGFAMAVAGGFRATERQMDFGADCRSVDVEDTSVGFVHCVKCAVYVLGIDGRGQ